MNLDYGKLFLFLLDSSFHILINQVPSIPQTLWGHKVVAKSLVFFFVFFLSTTTRQDFVIPLPSLIWERWLNWCFPQFTCLVVFRRIKNRKKKHSKYTYWFLAYILMQCVKSILYKMYFITLGFHFLCHFILNVYWTMYWNTKWNKISERK